LQENLGFPGPKPVTVVLQRHGPKINRGFGIQLEVRQPVSVGGEGPRKHGIYGIFRLDERLGLAGPIGARPG
jgi:hypothetical protein